MNYKQSKEEYIKNTGLKIISVDELVSKVLEKECYFDFRTSKSNFELIVSKIKERGFYIPREMLRNILQHKNRCDSYRIQYIQQNDQHFVILTNKSIHQMNGLYSIEKKRYPRSSKTINVYKTEYIVQ